MYRRSITDIGSALRNAFLSFQVGEINIGSALSDVLVGELRGQGFKYVVGEVTKGGLGRGMSTGGKATTASGKAARD